MELKGQSVIFIDEMNPNIKILFIGGGNMAQAIIAGLISKNYNPDNIFVIDRNEGKLSDIQKKYQVHTSQNVADFASQAEVIFLAIKPQGAKTACETLKPLIEDRQPLIISVMAGITIEILNSWLRRDLSIIRTMPNTPALVQKGATGIFALPNVLSYHRQLAEFFLGSIGIIAWVTKENDLNIITALSGSGPAYYLYFIELMTKIAINMGLSTETADLFAIQTAYGASELAHQHERNVIELRQQVTSKKGTTEAAIKSMEFNKLEDIFRQAMQACVERAIALSKEA